MNRTILLIAYHYPPDQSSSGLLRTLSFSRALADAGWDVTVLAAKSGCEIVNSSRPNSQLIPENVEVVRTAAPDIAGLLSIAGKYPSILEVPDRNLGWGIGATITALKIAKEKKIGFIYTTYPVASAHLVGVMLKMLTNINWIADFRDPMLMDSHPSTKARRWSHGKLEKMAIARCDRALFTTEDSRRAIVAKYPKISPHKFHVIENGFDEYSFRLAEAIVAKESLVAESGCEGETVIRLLHSGTLYPDHRDPTNLFLALVEILIDELPYALDLVLLGTGHNEYYEKLISTYNLNNFVRVRNTVDYVQSIVSMLMVDGLVLIQGEECDEQIPAKMYEYFRTGKPTFAMVSKNGATAEALVEHGGIDIADISSAKDVKYKLLTYLDKLNSKKAPEKKSRTYLERYSRKKKGEEFLRLVEDLSCENTT